VTDQPDRAAIRARAQLRAVQMGYARPPGPEDDNVQAPAPEPLPTANPRALRALLSGHHLTPGQAESARRLFKAAREYVATDHPDTGDAA
jgi:hypothetical protein